MTVADSPIVLYDAACVPCRNLAALAARRAGGELRFRSWQEHGTAEPVTQLGFLIDGELVEGTAAWALLLEKHRDLAALDWLAARFGLRPQTARVLQSAGSMVRRLCLRCGRR